MRISVISSLAVMLAGLAPLRGAPVIQFAFESPKIGWVSDRVPGRESPVLPDTRKKETNGVPGIALDGPAGGVLDQLNFFRRDHERRLNLGDYFREHNGSGDRKEHDKRGDDRRGDDDRILTDPPVSTVPEPSSLLLLSTTALLCWGAARARRWGRKSSKSDL